MVKVVLVVKVDTKYGKNNYDFNILVVYVQFAHEAKGVCSLPYVTVINVHLCKTLCVIMELRTCLPLPCTALKPLVTLPLYTLRETS